MKVQKVSSTPRSNLAFGKLVLQKDVDYSAQQQKLIAEISTIANMTNEDDKKKRSYLDFLEKKCNQDLYLKAGSGYTKLQVYTIDRTTGEAVFLRDFTKNSRPGEFDLQSFCHCAADEIKDRREKILAYALTGLMLFAALFAGVKNKSPQKAVNTARNEILIKDLKPLQNDTINITSKVL